MFDKIEDTDEMEIMKLLLEHGADPNRKNADGDTVLHLAAINGEEYWPVAKLLMEYGANPNLKGEDKLTAIEIAEKEGAKKMVETLRGL